MEVSFTATVSHSHRCIEDIESKANQVMPTPRMLTPDRISTYLRLGWRNTWQCTRMLQPTCQRPATRPKSCQSDSLTGISLTCKFRAKIPRVSMSVQVVSRQCEWQNGAAGWPRESGVEEGGWEARCINYQYWCPFAVNWCVVSVASRTRVDRPKHTVCKLRSERDEPALK